MKLSASFLSASEGVEGAKLHVCFTWPLKLLGGDARLVIRELVWLEAVSLSLVRDRAELDLRASDDVARATGRLRLEQGRA